jgi:4-hydroxy-tetrahydrodipicolinate reductase
MMQMKSIGILGLKGRMGQSLAASFAKNPWSGWQLLADPVNKDFLELCAGKGENSFDALIDFSSPQGTSDLIAYLNASPANGKKCAHKILIGTTGLSEDQVHQLKDLAAKKNHLIVQASNTSFGVIAMAKTASELAKSLAPKGYDIEVVETHHNKKVDAPSGTALFLAKTMQKAVDGSTLAINRQGQRVPHSIGITSIRGGGVVGEHEIRFISAHEELKLSHRAFSRDLFADGAWLILREMLSSQKTGYFQVDDFLS